MVQFSFPLIFLSSYVCLFSKKRFQTVRCKFILLHAVKIFCKTMYLLEWKTSICNGCASYSVLCTLSPLNSVHRIFVCWRGSKIIIVHFHLCLFSSFSWISCFHAITYSKLVHSQNANQIIFSLISCVRKITYKLVNIAWIPPFFLLINHLYNFFSLPFLYSNIFLFKEMSDLYIAFVYVKSGFRFMRSPDAN